MTQSRGDIPEKIDRYEILEAVGFGAMGAVYRAFDPLIKRPVALKTLRLDVPPTSPDYRAFLERFKTEARTAGRLSHPNIITLYDVGHTEDQIPWLAMEFVEGETVAQLLEREKLPPELVVGLVSQIASAIDFAHGEGVIHRDIKPSNVIVYAGEKVKVTDFGIAKLMDGEMTHSGLMMGTPSYMSPEQAMGEELDGRTDIFSLGVVAFEMLSGQQPFPGNNVTSILYKLVHADPVHPDDLEVLGLLPEKWHQVFTRVLAKEPAERYATAAEFVRDLELCLGSWFGALEGETLIVNDPSVIASLTGGGRAGANEDDAKGGGGVAEDEDRTVALAPGSEPSGEGEGDDETVLLAPPASIGERRDSESPSEPSDGVDETVAVPPPGTPSRGPDDTDPEITLGGPAGPPRPAEIGEVTVPDAPAIVTDRARAAGPRRGKKPYVVVGAVALGLMVVSASALLLRSSGSEWDTLPAPTEPVIPDVPPPPTAGSLVVTTEPEGARVLVNGEELGTTPLELRDLPFGQHLIRIEREGFEPEEIASELTAEAPEASHQIALTAVPAPPSPAYLRVTSNPEGAQVLVDGREVGSTPTSRLRVRAGERRIRLVREGFVPWEDSVRARSGATAEVEAELMRRPAEPPEPEPALEPEPEPQVRMGELVERGDPGVVDPKCSSCPAVRYPEAAKRAGLSGVVELGYLIDENGNVSELQVRQSGGDVFDEAVLETVSEWQYEPATKLGVRVKMRWIQRFRFQQGR